MNLQTRPDYARLLELNAVVLEACESEAHQRYQSAEEMHADLALLQRGEPVKAQRATRRLLLN